MPQNNLWLMRLDASIRGVQYSRYCFIKSPDLPNASIVAAEMLADASLVVSPLLSFDRLRLFDTDLTSFDVPILPDFAVGQNLTTPYRHTSFTTLSSAQIPPELRDTLDQTDKLTDLAATGVAIALARREEARSMLDAFVGREVSQEDVDAVKAKLDAMPLEDVLAVFDSLRSLTQAARELYPLDLGHVVIQARGSDLGFLALPAVDIN